MLPVCISDCVLCCCCHHCRAALLVAGRGTTPMTDLLQAALQDFGTEVTLLEHPTEQQLQQGLQALQVCVARIYQHCFWVCMCVFALDGDNYFVACA